MGCRERGLICADAAGIGICVAKRVKYAVNTETDERVAIKVLDKEKIQKQNMGAQIKKEISIMKMVRHKHVVVLKEVLASRTKVRSGAVFLSHRTELCNSDELTCLCADFHRARADYGGRAL